ncbi:PrsW family intramembrane metalloprotease [Raineyella sp. LH-20]|uniref:PrsW family intramembrane metalloprotease n=1 Tax=Raineyella sp. LH-20 TaxID=3081204 RepID=UPI002954DF41|nr:PrsW family intramembrane metalloprotease [Raineyella sp. LH-20]WOP18556.1 PrsW family intramembrane metalloprotease [Raineyella sp. LH-20]
MSVQTHRTTGAPSPSPVGRGLPELPSPGKGRRKDTARARLRRDRRRNGLPAPVDRTVPLARRLLGDWRLWMSAAMVVIFVAAFLVNWTLFVPEHTTATGTIQGLGTAVIPKAARLAAFTAVPLAVVFVLADRLRPQGLWLWAIALVWGGLVATAIAAPINTWASAHLSIVGDGDPATSLRGAVFVAPFVEEAAKATVVFWIAILLRHRAMSWLSTVALAGLSGTGFAFVENIVYYGRIYRYVSVTSGTGVDAQQAMNQLALMRGGMTFFAHPLFTVMTGIGVATALRARSKRVRVLAPLTGFLVAALLHMVFNFTASADSPVGLMLWFVALSLVGAVVGVVLGQLRRERAVLRARLTEYGRYGWLDPATAEALVAARVRIRARWYALWRGPATFLATWRLQRAAVELAYLRDAVGRGLVDSAGPGREAELLRGMHAVLPAAVVVGVGAIEYPWQRWRQALRDRVVRARQAPPSLPADGGPLGSSGVEYSPVDPRWGPPEQ